MQHFIGWLILLVVLAITMYGMISTLGWRETLKTVVLSLTFATAIIGGVYLVNT